MPVAATTNVTRVCGGCGSKLFADAPQGLCSLCLFRAALGPLLNESVAADDDGDAADSERIPSEFGDYELLEEIGRGGQGVVFRARQKSLSRTVALKVIGLGTWATEVHLKRFRREAEAAASLDHPGIVPIYEVGERDGSCYFSMKFIEGGQLDEVVRQTPMSIRQAAELVAKLARTVHYAHDHGILHRDIKPGNILLDKSGEPHLADFGLARLLDTQSSVTRTIDVLGTPSYMAPEQAAGETSKLSKATDVYGLGAVLYQLLTGQPPFAGGTTYETIRLLRDTEPRHPRVLNPKVDRDLSTICLKCLEKDPKRRYSSAVALAEDLEHWLKHEPIVARHSGVVARGRKWVRRNPTTAALVASLVALAAAVGAVFWERQSPSPATGVVAIPYKSVAVLPFENLSIDPEDALLTDGMQAKILTDLAKIADLKVIGRSSVMEYKSGVKRNVREIANALGVAHVVEGSVERVANRVRISAKLIDAKTGRLIWDRNYDRTLADSVTLEGDLAMEIATAVGVTLSPQEKARVTAKPTNNSTAYDAYLDGRVFASEDETEKALHSYQKAVEFDPNFVLAWAGLSSMQSLAHWELDSNPERVSAAKAAMDRALALNPNLPEVHLALGYYRYYVLRDFTGALSELREAEPALPNDTDVIKTIAMVQRRLGQWEESLAGFQRVVQLDPRDIDGYGNLAMTYEALRRFPEALAVFDRALSWEPIKLASEAAWKKLILSNGAWKTLLLMKADAQWATGDLASTKLPYESAYTIAFMRAGQELLKHGYTEAKAILFQALADKSIVTQSSDVFENREILVLMLGLTQQRAGDIAAARGTYQQVMADARRTLEKVSPGSPAEAQARVNLAWAYAGLGEADSAIEEGRKAMAIMPGSKDAYRGPKYEENIARIYALLGDADHAVPILERLLQIPYLAPLTLAKLRTDPTLDQIRNAPAFQKLCEEKKK